MEKLKLNNGDDDDDDCYMPMWWTTLKVSWILFWKIEYTSLIVKLFYVTWPLVIKKKGLWYLNWAEFRLLC